jgi:hypothetical protein
MAIKTKHHPEYSEEVRRLLRKADQASQMGSRAAAEGDKIDAAKHFAEDKRLQQQARELHTKTGETL